MIDKAKRFANKNAVCRYIINVFFILYGCLFSLLCFCMRIFPIQNNKILCCSVKGKRYGDNPMYLSDELLRRKEDYEIVWLLQKNVEVSLPDGVRRVNYALLPLAYELATAKVWIDSNMKQYGVLKRKGQLYMQTWHGSYGLKKIGRDLEGKASFSYIDKTSMKYNARIIDVFLSNSRQTTEIYRRAFWYRGTVLEYGSPRNDLLFGETESCRRQVQKHFGIQGKKIALYAPTFRHHLHVDMLNLDYERMRKALGKRFGGEWVILCRLHPNNIVDAERFMRYDGQTINATYYNVMQELLAAADVLFTDYSSCMFDFVTKGKVCFLYVADIACYKEDRDNYFELWELPFPSAVNNEQMEEAILRFDETKYRKELEKLFEKVGLCESGCACKQTVDYIEQWIKNGNSGR